MKRLEHNCNLEAENADVLMNLKTVSNAIVYVHKNSHKY